MLLNVKNILFKYPGGQPVLKGASFSADKGEVVSIIGPNGSGKTTLLLLAAGLLEPNNGEVLLEERNIRDQLPEIRRRIGLVFQDPDDQLFNPTVREEILFTLRQLYPNSNVVKDKIANVAKKFELKSILDKPPYRLSMGEKRIISLASILAYDPDLLLLDEPTANLSSIPIEKIEKIIKEAKNSGKSIVIASHDVEFVAKVSDRIYVIDMGRMLGGTDTKSILSDNRLLLLADMKPPLVSQTLRALGVKNKKIPLTVDELKVNKSKFLKN